MQQYRDLQERTFFEVKNIIDNLARSENADEFLLKKDLFSGLSERLSFLKILSENDYLLTSENEHEFIDNQHLNSENNSSESLVSEHFSHPQDLEISEGSIPEFVGTEEVIYTESEDTDYEIPVEQISYKQLVEFEEEPTLSRAENFEEENQHSTIEKKFKIAPIKGLKAGTEFSAELPSPEIFHEEQPQHFKNFRLDLNDRIAFSNALFGGNFQELDSVTERLNGFDNLDDAKQFLSDIYYQRDWSKVDDFAQRLWILVENKFL